MPGTKNTTNSSLSRRVYAGLKVRIESGEWNYGAMLPSEIELAGQIHISRGTIRRVLAELEREGWVSRERGRGTFVVYPDLRRASSGVSSQSISFIVPYVRDSYVSSILLGLERAARTSGFAVLFSHVENDLEKQEAAIQAALVQGVAGMVLYPVNSSFVSPLLTQLTEQEFPIVLVDRYIRGLEVDFVASDNFYGGLIATQHLLGLGHRRIAFLCWQDSATSIAHRKAGYRQALIEAGLPLQPILEWEVVGYPEIDRSALEKRLRAADRPGAIFAANDQLAIAVQRAARALDLRIPEDIALVGFDNLEISAHLDIPLSTVAQPAFEIGRTAWEMLHCRILSEVSCVQKRILPVNLIVRSTCGAKN